MALSQKVIYNNLSVSQKFGSIDTIPKNFKSVREVELEHSNTFGTMVIR